MPATVLCITTQGVEDSSSSMHRINRHVHFLDKMGKLNASNQPPRAFSQQDGQVPSGLVLMALHRDEDCIRLAFPSTVATLRQQKPPTFKSRIAVLQELVASLKTLEEDFLVHRAVTLDNILVDDKGQTHLFGGLFLSVAYEFDERGFQDAGSCPNVSMPPEAWADTRSESHLVDDRNFGFGAHQYAIGIIIAEIWPSADPAFRRPSELFEELGAEAWGRQLGTGWRCPLPFDWPSSLTDLVRRCWEESTLRPPLEDISATLALVRDEGAHNQLCDTSLAAPRITLQASHFKALYSPAVAPQEQHKVFAATQQVIYSFCKMNEIAPAKEERYWKTLKEELLQQTVTEAGAQELTSEPDVLCIRLWTSAKVLEGVEFCGILNRALRRDDAELLGTAVPLMRGMSSYLVQRKEGAGERKEGAGGKHVFPKVVWRGSSLPSEFRGFFVPDVKFRIPSFFATSSNQDVALCFMRKTPNKDMRVLWVVHLPSAAECAHVRLIDAKSSCKGEEEYLFPPYSTFTVLSSSKDEQGHYVVELQAAACNKLEDESLPSAPWS